ncbi:DUF151 domain-containing protein [bacterium]|nr:DUF151 domain-containing protein [bacterium]
MTETEELIRMKVTGLTIDPFTNMPIIILKDMQESMALPIWIGLIEASSIATELEKVELTRPMTHDLMKKIIDLLGAKIHQVVISDLTDNTFMAEIELDVNGQIHVMDSRPSDAIAIALRTQANIFVNKRVIEKSRRIDLAKKMDDGEVKEQKWAEILESLAPEDFGKYKM